MSEAANNTPPTSDICLLLRAYGEQRWLLRRVAPIVAVLERCDAGEDRAAERQRDTALAFLEAAWLDARRFALETDGAYARLAPAAGGSVRNAATRYRGAVRRERAVLRARVERLLAAGRGGGCAAAQRGGTARAGTGRTGGGRRASHTLPA